MHPLSVVLFAVLLVSTAALPYTSDGPLRIPIHKRSGITREGVVDLDAARAHIARSEQRYREGLTALERHHGARLPSSGGHTPIRRAVGADALTGDGDVRWYGTISVGTPAVEYKVDFDTGSADLFLPASDCGSTCDGHTRYNPQASSSAADLHQNFSISYGDGSSVAGELYSDAVTIAGFVATNQTVGAASQYSTSFRDASFAPDGLMGMAFSEISTFRASPVIETLVSEGQLSDPVFAFKLASSGSELSIGGVNSALYTGSFSYTPVTQRGYWQISPNSINANGRAISTDISAIVDTGTTFILGDEKIVGQFYSALNATSVDGGFYIRESPLPCDAMPDVSITIGGTAFAISAETFNLGSYNSSGTSCIGAITATGELGDTWILGDVFLRNVYSVFDVGRQRVGFATLA